ncbi:MAG: lipoyl(octanoyl) transferase LipB [Muribaculaceae bacterium]|nr:lipoyl(octanoyl) transferase LipB [Muribaculaceae bacterium]
MIFIEEPEGPQNYITVLEHQRELFNQLVNEKRANGRVDEEFLILVEHSPVITLGRRASYNNLLISEESLSKCNIDVVRIERGGDITYHGPGQLVMYPIIDLELHRLGVKTYVNLLEEAVILTLAEFGINGERVEGATGVWVGKGSKHERKICAIGVKCSRFITMHGLALNVNTDLSPFQLINPCGFTDKGVTSISKELGHEVNYREVVEIVKEKFLSLLYTDKK